MLDETLTYMSNKALLGIEKKRKGGRFDKRRRLVPVEQVSTAAIS